MAAFDKYLEKVGKNIRKARERMGLRQTDLCDRIGLHYRHYQEIEAGRINLTVGTLCRISKALELSAKELVMDD